LHEQFFCITICLQEFFHAWKIICAFTTTTTIVTARVYNGIIVLLLFLMLRCIFVLHFLSGNFLFQQDISTFCLSFFLSFFLSISFLGLFLFFLYALPIFLQFFTCSCLSMFWIFPSLKTFLFSIHTWTLLLLFLFLIFYLFTNFFLCFFVSFFLSFFLSFFVDFQPHIFPSLTNTRLSEVVGSSPFEVNLLFTLEKTQMSFTI
jgi:hypothetical protein